MLHYARRRYARGYAQGVFLCTPNTRSGRVHVRTIVKTRRCARPRTAVQYASLTNAAAAAAAMTTVENIKNDGNETNGVHTILHGWHWSTEQKSIVFAEGGETEKNVLGQWKNQTTTTAVERAKNGIRSEMYTRYVREMTASKRP